ncbi:hypothetical protein L5515_009359 [Caenorhabditis briggsae]|uniref:Lin-15A/B-like domain-containing protein n=1 Tax=Caenorhabditis briggsae TaxID=6238 RepID=A0AAE9F3X6_CAEBR|nr:hypothetical protein L5515_009359 [Caenorhabditis briggsae]
MKFAGTPFEKRLRRFIAKNKHLIKVRFSQRGFCKVCHMLKDHSECYAIGSKRIRMMIMIGCILRGIHSIDPTMYYETINNMLTCYSHLKETIDKIFEHLGISGIQELFRCHILSMGSLVDIARNFDPKFTADQFFGTFHMFYMKEAKF